MNMKKAQMEILGLAIVIVILLIASIFVVRFIILDEKPDYRKGFITSELASNMLNTYLDTTAKDCSKLSMTELIRDCSQGSTITCQNNGNPQDSCIYARETAELIFSDTLDTWGIDYEFSTYTEGSAPFISLGPGCPKERKTKIFPIPAAATVNVRLDIC